jgi:hypothetical protein
VNGNVEKVNKMCSKGLDPNFHCADSGGEKILFFVVIMSHAKLS